MRGPRSLLGSDSKELAMVAEAAASKHGLNILSLRAQRAPI